MFIKKLLYIFSKTNTLLCNYLSHNIYNIYTKITNIICNIQLYDEISTLNKSYI